MKYRLYATDEDGRYEVDSFNSYEEAESTMESYKSIDKITGDICKYEIETEDTFMSALKDEVAWVLGLEEYSDDWQTLMNL